ncbi:general transcription factor IIE subunit 2, partial [Caerostris extrusa]
MQKRRSQIFILSSSEYRNLLSVEREILVSTTMDPALLREREAFKKRALSNPVVEKKKEKNVSEPPKKKPKAPSQPKQQKDFNYKTHSGGVLSIILVFLAKIVKHMKQRHLNGDSYPLSLEEILDETNQLDVGIRQKIDLLNE